MHTLAVKNPPKQAFFQKGTPINTTKTANFGLGMGGVFNLVKMHVYHYAGNTSPGGTVERAGGIIYFTFE